MTEGAPPRCARVASPKPRSPTSSAKPKLQTAPAFQTINLSVADTMLGRTGVTVTPSWLAATHTTELTYDVSPAPSAYDSAWQIPQANVFFADLTASSTVGGVLYQAACNNEDDMLAVRPLTQAPSIGAMRKR